MEEAWEDVWQEGLEELVPWNSGLRGVVEEVWQEVWQPRRWRSARATKRPKQVARRPSSYIGKR